MMLIFHIFSYFRFKKKYCIIGKSLFIIKMKNAIYNLKKINVCDLRWNKLFIIFTEYLFDTKKGVLSGYRLYPVVLKGNNNRGKEVNFKRRKAKM